MPEVENMESTTNHLQRLPVLWLNGREYFVDFNLREFRSPANRFAPAEFFPFESARGQAFWAQYLIATCSRCGVERIEPKHASGLKCQRCGEWVLL